MITASKPALPGRVPDDAGIYLRPLALTRLDQARGLVEAGEARRLAGGLFAFARCELMIRAAGRLECYCAPVAEIADWAGDRGGRTEARIATLLERLTSPRTGPEGRPLDQRPLLMGIINVTPDSFADGGRTPDPHSAIAHGLRLAEEGAAILDVGGESTRPGADPVTPAVECARVLPVLAALSAEPEIPEGLLLSIDTRRADTMSAALTAGARIINDVSALTDDAGSLAAAAASNARVVLVHKQGDPRTMNRDPRYSHAPLDVFDYLEARIEACEAAGIARSRLIVDPGIAFGKRGQHNLEILQRVTLLHGLGCPILLGLSRKGLTGALDRRWPPEERLPGSLAAAVWALNQGVQMLRVHDVAETRQALEVWARVMGIAP